jgi:hypothetical protein
LTRPKADFLQGTLDMLILQALTKAGSQQLAAEEESRDRLALAIAKVRKAV